MLSKFPTIRLCFLFFGATLHNPIFSLAAHWLLRLTVSICLMASPSFAVAQTESKSLPSKTEVEAASAALKSDSSLTGEEKAPLLETYSRITAQLNTAEEERKQLAVYNRAIENAAAEAKDIRDRLDADIAAAEGKTVELPSGLTVDAAEQQVQADRSSLKTMEDQLARLRRSDESSADTVKVLRDRIAETQKLIDELDASGLAEDGETAREVEAQSWLQAAQSRALEATKERLEAELLSRPMREQLMSAQRDRLSFDIAVVRARVKAYESAVLNLQQARAQQALSEVSSTQQSVADSHPEIRALASANTVLSAEITARTSALEALNQAESVANEQAQRFEQDLASIKRKLEVLGMSEALGRILREQQQRLPKPLYSRADVTQRDRMITEASIKQLELEDERRSLLSLGTYVDQRIAELPEPVKADIRSDMLELSRTRRELVRTALGVETQYLRALGDLDFAVRRVETSASTYRDFISERLLWLRSSSALSFERLRPLPEEILDILTPSHWWTILQSLPSAILSSALYPVLLLLVAILLRYHGLLRERLERTGDVVGRPNEDRYTTTAVGLLYTFLLAATWPLLTATLGSALENVAFDGRMERGVGYALKRLSIYFFGLEFLRYLLIRQGLMRHHFGWADESAKRIAKKVWQLEVVFIPAVFIGIVANRSLIQQGQSVLASIALIAALLALSRFFMLSPGVAQGQLAKLMVMRSPTRQSLLGRALRYLLTLLPLALVACIVLGYTHTAIEFLASLVGTLGLFVGLILLHELGVRWLLLMRARLVERERQSALEAAREAAEEGVELDDEPLHEFDARNPDELDNEGRNLLNTVLAVLALTGIWGVWSDVLPALGILDSVELWSTSKLVDGVETRAPVTPLDIFKVLLVTFAGFVATQRLPSLLDLFLRQKVELAAGTVYATVTLIRYVLIAVFVATVLGMLGADWSQIQWAVAALSVGIGFGLQEIVANFISGIILLFEQPIRVGDIVTVGETSGKVTKIRMRATTVRDWDGRELLVPNKEFITGRLLNWSLSDQQTRLVIEIGVAYGSDVPKAMKLALDTAMEHPKVLTDPEPFITFDAFGDSSLLLTLRLYLPSLDGRLEIGSELRNAINDKYNEAGIVIAFPQRDIHLNTNGPLEINLNSVNDASTTGSAT